MLRTAGGIQADLALRQGCRQAWVLLVFSVQTGNQSLYKELSSQ